jgi:hypothetical protein
MELIKIEIPAKVNKTEILRLADSIVTNAIEEGNVLKVAEGLSVLDKIVEAVRKEPRFVGAVVSELEANNRKVTTDNKTVIECIETAVKYDYSHNAEWVSIDNAIKEWTDKRKQLEGVLRTIAAGKELVDTESGEVLTGAAKQSKSSYKVTLAK